jgi:hypothetical protein
MQHLVVCAIQVFDKQVLGRLGSVESCTQNLGSGSADIAVVASRQCQERTGLDRIFLVGRRAGGDGAALLGDVLGIPDLGEGANVAEAVGDLLDGYEGEDAWAIG